MEATTFLFEYVDHLPIDVVQRPELSFTLLFVLKIQIKIFFIFGFDYRYVLCIHKWVKFKYIKSRHDLKIKTEWVSMKLSFLKYDSNF